jgi:predicted enzyme related to lactoylglutathione lyase
MSSDHSPIGQLAAVTLDAVDVDSLVHFYSHLLGVSVDASLGDGPQYVYLAAGPGSIPVAIQRVPQVTPRRSALHMDVTVADLAAATVAAEALGAQRDEDGDITENGFTWRRMKDPEGNVFCLVQA